MTRRSLIGVLILFLLCLITAACARSGADPLEAGPQVPPKLRGAVVTTATAPEAPAPTTVPPPPIFPLTGQLLGDPAQAAHSAVVVKIDNHPDARPHTGLTKADIVYELKVEGITRFAAVYHSEDADPVGPVRSARSSDLSIVANLNKPVLLWSGGNPGVKDQMHGAEQAGFLTDLSEDNSRQYYFRDNRRQAPHNLYARMGAVREALAPFGGGNAPFPMFAYRNTDEPPAPTSLEAVGMRVDFGGGVRVDWAWDAERKGWDRFQVDERHPKGQDAFLTADGGQVVPQNVVILYTPYGVSEVDARSPKAWMTGEGDAYVLTDGHAYRARWKRESDLSMPILVDAAGNQIGLTAGRTWIEMPPADGPGPTALNIDEANQLLARRG